MHFYTEDPSFILVPVVRPRSAFGMPTAQSPIFKLLMSPGINSASYVARAGIFKHSMVARNRLGIGLSYRPARLHWLAELISKNRFLGSLKV
jgi:hypothetical protein